VPALLAAALAGAPALAQTPPAAGQPAPAAPGAVRPVPPPPGEPAPAPPTTLTLPQAIALALAANPTLAAARLNLPVAGAQVEVARERPNPDLLLEALRETPRQAATLSLPIETAGKRGRRVAAAEAGRASTEAELARTTAEVRNQVRRAYYGLAAAQARSAEQREVLQLSERVREAASARFEAGAAPRLEVLQAELTAAQASNEAESAGAQLAGARAELNTLLARPADAPLAADDELGTGAPPDPEAAVRLAAAASTELALLDRRLAAQEARVRLARAQQVPDPVVQGAVTHDAPPDFTWGWRAGITINLPVFHHHQAEVAVEERTLAQLHAERDGAAARIAGAVAAAAHLAQAQRDQLLRYRNQILPHAAEVEAMAEDSYRSGQTGLPALLQALQATRDLRLRALQSALDFQTALADLERAMGAPLP
jgi:cobalt-zinc-cadmium efflux system outer membrane protein